MKQYPLVGTPHPLAGKQIRVVWADDPHDQADYLVLGVAGALLKLQPLAPDKPDAIPSWRSEYDVRALWELEDLGVAPNEGFVPVRVVPCAPVPQATVAGSLLCRGRFDMEGEYDPDDAVMFGPPSDPTWYRCRHACQGVPPPADCWERVPGALASMLNQLLGGRSW